MLDTEQRKRVVSINVQGYSIDGRFIVKELALVSLKKIYQELYASPENLSINGKDTKTVRWLEDYYHGIPLDRPGETFDPAVIKRQFDPDTYSFYAKGLELCRIIGELFGVYPVNVEDLGCPKVLTYSHRSLLLNTNYLVASSRCLYHRVDSVHDCAQKKAVTVLYYVMRINSSFPF